MLKKAQYIALGAVVLLTLILLNLPAPVVGRLKVAIGSFFVPLFGLANSTEQLAERSVDALLPRSELARQNEQLHRDNQKLRVQAAQAEEILRENTRLRQQIGWKAKSSWRLKPANVVLREPANWWRTVHIDLGSRDGVRENLPVITPDGLVGRVSAVGLTRSQVVLLGDPNCRVSVLVEESRDYGVISPGSSGPLNNREVDVIYLSRNSDLKPGQTVVTSGLGGIFPKGIPVGRIVDSRPAELGLYKEARLKLSMNLNTLEEVWVLFP